MGYLLAFCLALCWGTAFLATKNFVTTLPPYWGTCFRVLAGLSFFIILYAIQRKNLKCPFQELWRPWTIGLLLILLPFAAMSWGQRFIDPTISGVFNGSVPIWSFIAGAIFLKGVDRFTWLRALGIVLGMTGLIVFMYPTLSAAQLSANQNAFYGCMALLVMAWSYGLGNVITTKIMVNSNAVSHEANTFHQYLFAAIALLLIAGLTEPFPPAEAFTAKVIISIISAGVFSSAVAFLLMIALIKRWGATRMASVTYFTPIVAMGSDIIARGRTPNGLELVGMGILFISLFLIQKPVKA